MVDGEHVDEVCIMTSEGRKESCKALLREAVLPSVTGFAADLARGARPLPRKERRKKCAADRTCKDVV